MSRSHRHEPRSPIDTTRRGFLRGAVSTGGVLALASGSALRHAAAATPAESPSPSPAQLPGGLDPSLFHLYSEVPLTFGTRRSAFGMGVVTPQSRFYVRNNLPMPSSAIVADPNAWALEVEGVAQPQSLRVADLKKIGVATITTVIQCSGNGRSFFEHGPSGSQWEIGAAGCAIWTGLPVPQLLESLGAPSKGMKFLTGTGGEPLPDGIDPLDLVVERSIPLEKGLDDCLLAWEMNGEPIPLLHGGPLRLIVPGYYGCNQIKYIRKLACTPKESPAKIQQTSYRMRPIGEPASPSQPSMWRMHVTSWLQGPGGQNAPVLQGQNLFHGVAFCGERSLEKIEFSLDGGAHWKAATWIGPEMGSAAWQQFFVTVDLAPGTYTIATRATDDHGETQPAERRENERGYGNTSWKDLALTVEVVAQVAKAPAAAPPKTTTAESQRIQPAQPAHEVVLSEEGAAGRRVFLESEPPCAACHTLADAQSHGPLGPNLNTLRPDDAKTVQAVTQGVGVMPSYRGKLSPEQIRDLARYISEAAEHKP